MFIQVCFPPNRFPLISGCLTPQHFKKLKLQFSWLPTQVGCQWLRLDARCSVVSPSPAGLSTSVARKNSKPIDHKCTMDISPKWMVQLSSTGFDGSYTANYHPFSKENPYPRVKLPHWTLLNKTHTPKKNKTYRITLMHLYRKLRIFWMESLRL